MLSDCRQTLSGWKRPMQQVQRACLTWHVTSTKRGFDRPRHLGTRPAFKRAFHLSSHYIYVSSSGRSYARQAITAYWLDPLTRPDQSCLAGWPAARVDVRATAGCSAVSFCITVSIPRRALSTDEACSLLLCAQLSLSVSHLWLSPVLCSLFSAYSVVYSWRQGKICPRIHNVRPHRRHDCEEPCGLQVPKGKLLRLKNFRLCTTAHCIVLGLVGVRCRSRGLMQSLSLPQYSRSGCF